MEAYKTSAIVHDDGTIVIHDLPFHKGQRLEVVLLDHTKAREGMSSYPLRGEPVRYVDPFEGVAEDDWGASTEAR